MTDSFVKLMGKKLKEVIYMIIKLMPLNLMSKVD